jgi:hypothetical protein
MVRNETILIVLTVALLLYLFATRNAPYVNIRDRDQPIKSKKKIVNWFGFRGPFFIEDFAGDVKVKNHSEINPISQIYDDNRDPFYNGQYSPIDEIYGTHPNTVIRKEGWKEKVNCSRGSSPNKANCSRGSSPNKANCPMTGHMHTLYNKNRELVPTNKQCEIPKYNTGNKKAEKCHRFAKQKCRIPELTSKLYWQNEFHNDVYTLRGPSFTSDGKVDLGNYRQVTNNNLDAPNNLKCQCYGRTCETCPDNERISQGCYAVNYGRCLDGK